MGKSLVAYRNNVEIFRKQIDINDVQKSSHAAFDEFRRQHQDAALYHEDVFFKFEDDVEHD